MSVTTITFFRFSGFFNQSWAFLMMQFAHRHLRRTQGQTFYKLMGSGKGAGFNPLPDWSVYCLLQCWENEAQALQFMESAPVFQDYRRHSSERWTLFLHTVTAKGRWSGVNPFENGTDVSGTGYLAVITRATIRWSRLWHFWRFVPRAQAPVKHAPGLLYTKGVGEAPVVQMATFSLWENLEAMQAYAYRSAEHLEAMRKTRELGWYSEELFVRFKPYRSLGTWGGANPLPDLAGK